MSTTTIRATLKTFFGAVTKIQQLYSEAPWIIQGQAFQLNAGTQSGAVGFVHIDKASERRITLPAYTGQKEVIYECSLVFLYQYMKPLNLPSGKLDDAWVVDLDLMIDQIKTLIRSDQNAGASAVVFQMGAGSSPGQYDITIEQDLPVDDGGALYELCRVAFSVTEILVA